MSEWWTYELSDFLLFSHRVYVRLFELHNADLWPAQVVTMLVGGGILCASVRPARHVERLVPLALGALWLWIAWSFFLHRYATINWTAPYVAPAFALQGIAFIALAAGPGLALTRSWVGSVLLAVSLFAYPLLAPMLGRPIGAAEVFGIAPDPTALATLAVLAATQRWTRWLLAVVPFLWAMLSGLALWTMGASEALVAPACALACCLVMSMGKAAK